MKQQPKGIKVYAITPCSSGFGEWELSGGVVFAQRVDLRERPELSGRIREQNGRTVVTGCDRDGNPVLGVTRHFRV